ncbi:MAG: family efflux transporter subunit [Planctomycetaceae bacterium]|nr:family efflux transporter subunit [Planctomycetaceae bacterium]
MAEPGKWARWFWVSVVCLGLAAAAGYTGFHLGQREAAPHLVAREAEDAHPDVKADLTGAEVIPGDIPKLRLSSEAFDALGIELAAVKRATANDSLALTGSLLIDSNRLAYVHSRFSGEVVSIGTIAAEPHEFSPQHDPTRPIRVGDMVKKGQLLAVVWSKEVGEKKSDLVDAISRLNSSKTTLERLEALERGSVSVQIVREARRQYEADLIAVDRAERTLRSWRETEEEILEVHQEAVRISKGDKKTDGKHYRESWANVEIRAPLDGTLLENNVSLGEIVDSGMVLFKVADLSRMAVLANVYEEDLPKLTALPPTQRQWRVRLKSDPEATPIEGAFEVIGNVIDPGQHTAAVIGWISNPGDKLRVGQFITAEVRLPVVTDAVIVPNSAVIDEGTRAFVFIAEKSSDREFKMRAVNVLRRGRDFALLARNSDMSAGSKEDHQLLQEGERVVTSGNLELFGVLQDKAALAAAKAN